MKKAFAQSLLTLMIAGALWPMAHAATKGPEVYVTDTVAGYGTLLRVNETASQEPIEIRITKPDGSVVTLETTTDNDGKAKLDLEGFYTRRAGTYTADARTEQGVWGNSFRFKVYADQLSTSRSTLQINHETAASNGNDAIELRIQLKDKYSNPLTGHTVQVLSSRTEDEIIRISPRAYTDEQGTIVYNLYSRKAGISTFLVHDSTENKTVDARAKIAFYSPSEKIVERGGEKNSVFLAAVQGGTVETLNLQNLPPTTKTGETLNFAVEAQNNGGSPVGNYTGTVRFSSSDNNARLPNDYTFVAEDQGSHTFSLGIAFQTAGTHTLTVTDLANGDIYGEVNIQVLPQSENALVPSGAASEASGEGLNLFTPASGTYSTTTLTFSGEATYGGTIEIMEGDKKLGEVKPNANNQFNQKIQNLSEGEHRFTAQLRDANGTVQSTTSEILVTIDSSAPELDKITLEPSGTVETGALITVTLLAEPGLNQVSITLNDTIVQADEKQNAPGNYVATLTAPEIEGDYTLDALLIDELGNEIKSSNIARITVSGGSEEIVYPSQVTGVEAVGGHEKITLSWQPPRNAKLSGSMIADEVALEHWETWTTLSEQELIDVWETLTEPEKALAFLHLEKAMELEEVDALPDTLNATFGEDFDAYILEERVEIHHYRIYYGPTEDLMYSTIDTEDNRLTSTLDNLSNGQALFLAVVAVDAEGNESKEQSAPISATPQADEAALLFAAAQEAAARKQAQEAEQAALEKAKDADNIDTGPELLWLLGISGGISGLYTRLRHRRTRIVPFNDIHA